MTMFNGLVCIDLYLGSIIVSIILSSQEAVLIHQFDYGQGTTQGNTHPGIRTSAIFPRNYKGFGLRGDSIRFFLVSGRIPPFGSALKSNPTIGTDAEVDANSF
jgi:hypothetical protein